MEENIAETLTFYRLPLGHHKYLKSTNMLERLNEEIKRRTRVVRIFTNAESCLRLIRALAVETHEGWLEEHRYLIMQLFAEHKREQLRQVSTPRLRKTSSPKTSSYRDQLVHNLTDTTHAKCAAKSSGPHLNGASTAPRPVASWPGDNSRGHPSGASERRNIVRAQVCYLDHVPQLEGTRIRS